MQRVRSLNLVYTSDENSYVELALKHKSYRLPWSIASIFSRSDFFSFLYILQLLYAYVCGLDMPGIFFLFFYWLPKLLFVYHMHFYFHTLFTFSLFLFNFIWLCISLIIFTSSIFDFESFNLNIAHFDSNSRNHCFWYEFVEVWGNFSPILF